MTNLKLKIISLIVAVGVGLGLVLVALGVFNKPALLTVSAEGAVKVAPTMVKFTVGVVSRGDNAVAALTENDRLTKGMINLLKGAGVEESEIVVAYARAVPPSLTQPSYQAVNAIDATLKDLIRFDNLVFSLYANGASSVSNILFTTENSQDLEKQAVAIAVQSAEARAREIARASGKRLGRMVSIQTVEIGEAGALAGSAPIATLNQPTSSSPSQIEIRRTAAMVFEVK